MPESKNPQINYQGVYRKIDFPAYRFQEYPKWVAVGDKQVIVQNLKHELDVKAEAGHTNVPQERHPIEGERDALATSLALTRDQLDTKEQEHAAAQARILELEAQLAAAKAPPVEAQPSPIRPIRPTPPPSD